MQESKSKKVPSFQSIDEVIYFFDTSDMGGYWDELPAADFEVRIKKVVSTAKRSRHSLYFRAKIAKKNGW